MFKQKFNARTLTAAVAAALAVGAASVTDAATTATSTLTVTASVTANCTITTAPLAFGAYDPVVANASTPLSGTGTLNVTCTNGAITAVTLGQGSNPATVSTDAAPARQLKDAGTDVLAYSLHSDAGHATVWTNTGGVAYTGTGTAGTMTVYGAVAPGQNVPAGTYSDTVVATITF